MQAIISIIVNIIFLAASAVILVLLVRKYFVSRYEQQLMWIAIAFFCALLSLCGLVCEKNSDVRVFANIYLTMNIGLLGLLTIFTILNEKLIKRGVIAGVFLQLLTVMWAFLAVEHVSERFLKLFPSMLVLSICELFSGLILKVFFDTEGKSKRIRYGVNLVSVALVADAFINLAGLYTSTLPGAGFIFISLVDLLTKLAVCAGFVLLIL